jgi:MscS family membrane protein
VPLAVTSVLAIGGIGGLAIGLAGREICENILNGFLIMSTVGLHICVVGVCAPSPDFSALCCAVQSPFEVGDEVHFFHPSKVVEGIVMDIGWYRTQIRSYEREVFIIPNAVFSKNIILNITRKNREFRYHDFVNLRVQDVQKVRGLCSESVGGWCTRGVWCMVQ